MANISTRLRVEAARSVAFGGIGANYAAVGGALTNGATILHFQNHTDATVWFSYDGTTDHFPLPSNGFLLLDITTNKGTNNGLYLPYGTTLYVKQLGVPTTGSVYLTVYYI